MSDSTSFPWSFISSPQKERGKTGVGPELCRIANRPFLLHQFRNQPFERGKGQEPISLKCVLKVLTPRFNQCGPWFGDMQIGANASLLQIFQVAETSMMLRLLLRVVLKSSQFWHEFWIQHFRSKCRWTKCKVRPK